MAADALAAIATAPSPQATPSAPGSDPGAGDPFAALVNEASQGPIGNGDIIDSKAISAFLAQDETPDDASDIDPLLLDQVAAAMVAPAPALAPDWLILTTIEASSAVGSQSSATAGSSAAAGPTISSTSQYTTAPHPTLGTLVPTLAAVTADLLGSSGISQTALPDQGESLTNRAATAQTTELMPLGTAGSLSQESTPPIVGDAAMEDLTTDASHMERTMVGLLHPFLKPAQPVALGTQSLAESTSDVSQPSAIVGGAEDPVIAVAAMSLQPRSDVASRASLTPSPADYDSTSDVSQPSATVGGAEDSVIAVAAMTSQPRSEGDQPRQQPAPTDAPPSSGVRHDPLAAPTALAESSTPVNPTIGQITRPTDPAPAVASPLPTPPAQPNPMEKAVVHQIGRALVKVDANGERHIVLRLTPVELGTVRIELRERDGQITAHLRTEDAAVGRSIERLLPQLRQDLRSGDSHLADVVVERHPRSVAENEAARDRQPNDGRGWGSGQDQSQSQRESRNRRNPDSPLFSLDDDTPALSSEPIPIARPRMVRSTGLDAVA